VITRFFDASPYADGKKGNGVDFLLESPFVPKKREGHQEESDTLLDTSFPTQSQPQHALLVPIDGESLKEFKEEPKKDFISYNKPLGVNLGKGVQLQISHYSFKIEQPIQGGHFSITLEEQPETSCILKVYISMLAEVFFLVFISI